MSIHGSYHTKQTFVNFYASARTSSLEGVVCDPAFGRKSGGEGSGQHRNCSGLSKDPTSRTIPVAPVRSSCKQGLNTRTLGGAPATSAGWTVAGAGMGLAARVTAASWVLLHPRVTCTGESHEADATFSGLAGSSDCKLIDS